jgi:hypothetical protein
MRLLRSSVPPKDLDLTRWNQVADSLRSNKGGLGDLGGGNNFLDAIAPYDDGPLHFLIHTGSRNESGHVDHLIAKPDQFDDEFERMVNWAADNRAAIHGKLDLVFGSMEVLLDLPHNTFEQVDDGGVVIRKGPVAVASRRAFGAAIAHVGRCCSRPSEEKSHRDSKLHEPRNWTSNVPTRLQTTCRFV